MHKKTNISKGQAAPKAKPRVKKISKKLLSSQDKQVADKLQPPQIAEPSPSFIKDKKLTTQDVCRQLGICPRTLSGYLKEGLLPYFKIRRRIWFSDRELAEALKVFRQSQV
jgi:hypothetical protein